MERALRQVCCLKIHCSKRFELSHMHPSHYTPLTHASLTLHTLTCTTLHALTHALLTCTTHTTHPHTCTTHATHSHMHHSHYTLTHIPHCMHTLTRTTHATHLTHVPSTLHTLTLHHPPLTHTLTKVNLYDARKCKSKALSGGMRRRLSVAMATIGNPDILILDEPTTGLDPASRRQVWEVIETVKEGRSMVRRSGHWRWKWALIGTSTEHCPLVSLFPREKSLGCEVAS